MATANSVILMSFVSVSAAPLRRALRQYCIENRTPPPLLLGTMNKFLALIVAALASVRGNACGGLARFSRGRAHWRLGTRREPSTSSPRKV